MRSARIFVADQTASLAATVAQLTGLGWTVVGAAESGHETMALAQQLRPDLVVIDTRLTGKPDGIETAALLRTNFCFPIVFLVEQDGAVSMNGTEKAEPFGFVFKPLQTEQLDPVIRAAWSRIRAYTHLKRSREHLEAVLHQAYDGFWLMDSAGKFLRVANSMSPLFGYTRRELLLMKVDDLDGEVERGSFAGALGELPQDGSRRFEHRWKARDGRRLDLEIHASLPSALSGDIWCYFRNITARKRVEDRLRQLSRAVEQSTASIILTDLQGRIEFANQRFFELTGYTASEVMGKNPRFLQSGHHSREFYGELWETIVAGGEWRGELQNRKKNGEIFWEKASILPVRDESGATTHFLGVKEDITQQKQAEFQLLQSKAELEKTNAALEESNRQLHQSLTRARELALEADAANRAKSAFLGNMSHELRTPLNAILGAAATLDEDGSQEDRRQSARLIAESGQSLLTIIEEILDYSGLQAGRTRLYAKPFHLLELIEQTLRIAAEMARAKGLAIGYRIGANVPAVIVGDARRIQQVLLNLLSNAVKFTAQGRVHLRVTAKQNDSGRWRFAFGVSDTGIGIPGPELARLFHAFSRSCDAHCGPTPGTGLGLVIARSFAQMMDGDIAVRTRPGRGSIFRCTMTVDALDGQRTALQSVAPPQLRAKRLLVVSEDRAVRHLIADAAFSWGLRAHTLAARDVSETWIRSHGAIDAMIVDQAVLRESQTALAQSIASGSMHVPMLWIARPEMQRTASPAVALPLVFSELARGLVELDKAEAGRVAAAPAARPQTIANLAAEIPLRVLAADDIPTNREILRRLMLRLGYKIDLVENGALAVSAAELRPYDLVLMDVQMPVMDGFTATEKIIELYPDRSQRPKIVAVTANALPGDREKCLTVGMDDYLSKPVLPKDIEACLRRLFAPSGAVRSEIAPKKENSGGASDLLDREHLAAMTVGFEAEEGQEMLRQLFASIENDYQSARPKLATECNERDASGFVEIVHGLKGCYSTLGWSRAARFCAQAIEEARAKKFSGWETFPAELESIFSASGSEMQRYLNRDLESKTPAPGAETEKVELKS